MSELPSAIPQAEEPAVLSFTEDITEQTQPTEELLNVLRQINPNSLASQNDNGELSNATQEEPPRSEWDSLRDKVKEKLYDADLWLKLVDVAEDSGDIEKIKETYEALLEAYPNTSSVQIAYLNHFLENPESFGFAEGLFKRFLRSSSSVDLWKFYLTYVRRVNTGPNAREIIRKSYEFALSHVGQDKDSTEIWTDYISFLKSGETTSTWEEQQKMDAIRKAYHRAVEIPMESVKKLWEDYQDFESSLNKITAKKFLSDIQSNHMQARTVLVQLQEHLTVLFPPPPPSRNGRPAIWLPRQPTFSAGDRALLTRWRAYLKWEESNPLQLDEKDKAKLIARLQGIYKKAIVRMRFFSEIWYMAYVYTNSIGKSDEALALLKAGIEANPSSFVLNFAYAEAQELAGNLAEVHTLFDKFIDVLRQDLEAVEAKVISANSSFSSNGSAPAIVPEPADQLPTGLLSNNSSFTTQVSDEKPSKSKEVADRRTEYGIAWIMYMRFARRAEGLKSSRTVFGRARRERWTPWEVYEAAALMEYHCTKALEVANRIFEKGMELFNDEAEFVLRYLGFLISINDDNSCVLLNFSTFRLPNSFVDARALFERVIGTFPPERARPIWERWGRYEYQYGDLAAAHKLEKRMAEVYPQGMNTIFASYFTCHRPVQ
ncbi:hypothetical protein WOLCODRAFT_69750 [Wolfiporia cocos MD-104 SS10]|uniref:mRNA 3'-end-processing protein RNA14 n=1 Tax=Wolfiporia cocos (strain MD-104) TaxID=742152 RepID=A0A2H3JZY8_WOLCO|nr:hypothetical protein WOLCODRAFT_69750 [Wolfiporia cocos MD-104 SS10]